MGGNFHVAPGKSFSLNHVHIHDVHPFSSSTFNMSHTINHLSFGQRIDFANTHPMDNMQVIAKDGEFNCSIFTCIYVLVGFRYTKEKKFIEAKENFGQFLSSLCDCLSLCAQHRMPVPIAINVPNVPPP